MHTACSTVSSPAPPCRGWQGAQPALCPLLSARYQKTPLSEARVVFYGAGSSAVGVAEQLAVYMEQASGRLRGGAVSRLCRPTGRQAR